MKLKAIINPKSVTLEQLTKLKACQPGIDVFKANKYEGKSVAYILKHGLASGIDLGHLHWLGIRAMDQIQLELYKGKLEKGEGRAKHRVDNVLFFREMDEQDTRYSGAFGGYCEDKQDIEDMLSILSYSERKSPDHLINRFSVSLEGWSACRSGRRYFEAKNFEGKPLYEILETIKLEDYDFVLDYAAWLIARSFPRSLMRKLKQRVKAKGLDHTQTEMFMEEITTECHEEMKRDKYEFICFAPGYGIPYSKEVISLAIEVLKEEI